jgi:hypothetical protein
MAYKQPELSGEFRSWMAEGAKDFHNAIVPAFPDSQRGVDQAGTPLSPTSQMTTDSLYSERNGEYEAMRDEYARQGQEAAMEAPEAGAPGADGPSAPEIDVPEAGA